MVTYSPWRRTRFAAGQELALLGEPSDLKRFVPRDQSRADE